MDRMVGGMLLGLSDLCRFTFATTVSILATSTAILIRVTE